MRRPSHCLNCSCVVTELHDWLTALWVPDEQFVIIAARAELLLVKGPLEPTNFLLMADKLAKERAAASQIAMQDSLVPRARAEDGRIPGNGTDSIRVAMHDSYPFHFVHVPDLDLPAVRA